MTENTPSLDEAAVPLLEIPPVSPAIGQRGVQNQGGFLTPYYLFDLLERQHEEELDPAGREPSRSFLRKAFRQAMRGWRSDLATTAPTLQQTWKLWYETLFEVLGFRQLRRLDAPLETSRYGLVPVSHTLDVGDDTDETPLILIDLHPFGTDLDHARYPGSRTRHRADDEITNEPISRAIEFVLDHNQTRWAFLSNGSELRLYRKGGSVARQYLKIDFSALFDNDDDKEWLVFWGLFRLAAFLAPETPTPEKTSEGQTPDRRCLLERVIEESQRHATKIANDLRENMVRAVEVLLQGIIDSLRNGHHWQGSLEVKRVPSEDQLKELFKEAIYFLYRLLFILYAESRDLLPVSDSEVYRETYSLEHLRGMVERRIRPEDYDKTYYIQTLRTLFEMLRNGYPPSNPATGDPATRTKSGAPFVIPPYNGQLFDPARTRLLDQCHIPDYAMREVIYELSLSRPRNRYERRERYSYADLGVDQLGSIYEGLLVYEPFVAEEAMVEARIKGDTRLVPREQADELELDYDHNAIKPAGSFLLRIWGGRRKGSGSYYTPQEITAFLVKDALAPLVEPIVEGCAQRDEQGKPLRSADEILKLKVCDPAMGSGAFLVQACRYLGEAYGRALVAEGRSDHERISAAELARYKRHVAERCIYGVDLNPLAVELAKVSLWLETLAHDRPLTFLDAHLRCGNSLIGAPLRNHEGRFDQFSISLLPTEAYSKPPEVDSKAYGQLLNRLKTENRKQISQLLAGQKTIFSGDEERHIFAEYEQQRLQMEESDENKSLEEAVALVYYKQEILQAALSGDESEIRRFKQLCDLWCAVWFWPFDVNLLPPTTLLYHDLAGMILHRPNQYVPRNADGYLQLAQKIAYEQHFFHWELEFPEVWCDEAGDIRLNGGFDAIVGNPPWDKIKPNEREFYSNYNPTIWNYQGTARKQLMAQLNADPDILSAWGYYQRILSASLALLFEGNLYEHQIAIVDGERTGGDPDTFKFFTERAFQLLHEGGRAGIIVPHGIQATMGCTALRHLLLDDCNLQILCRLDNERRIFSGVFHGQKFDLLVFAKGGPTKKVEAAFFSWEKAEVINDFRSHPRYVQIDAKIWRELSSELYTFVELHTYREVELVSHIYATYPRLDKQLEDAWNVSFVGGMHMTNDSHLFRDGERLQLFGATKLQGRGWKTPSASWLDSQEGRYIKSERSVNSKGQLYFPDELDAKRVKHYHRGYLLRNEADNRQALPIIEDENYYPLYEGRMVHQFDHAAKAYISGSGRSAKWRMLNFDEKEIVPHYFVAQRDYSYYDFRAGFCDVTGQANERSLLTAMIPSSFPCGNTIPTLSIVPQNVNIHLLWIALTNSFVVDWLIRLRMSNHINFFVLGSLAMPRPKVESLEAQSLIQAAVGLTCTTPEFASLWLAVTGKEWEENSGVRNLFDRAQLRAEIDARVTDLYGLSELDFAYILSTFPLIDSDQPALPGEPKSFITRDLALLALFTLRGKAPPDNIISFFAVAGVDIRHQTGAIVDLRKRVRVAQQEFGAIAYQPSGHERDEGDMEVEEQNESDFEDEE